MNIIRPWPKATLRISQHCKIIFPQFKDSLTHHSHSFTGKITQELIDQLAFRNPTLNPCWHRFSHRLQFGERLETKLIDIDSNGHRRNRSGSNRRFCSVGFVRKSHEKSLGKTTDLSAQHRRRPLVPKNHIRAGHLFLERKLGSENRLNQEFIEPTACLEPLDLSGAGRSDNEHLRLAEIKSLLKEERNVCDE